MFYSEGRKGLIEFGRDGRGNLVWRVTFEVPLPDTLTKRDSTIFQDSGVVVQTKEPHSLAVDYRGAIQAMARKFDDWQKISSRMWQKEEK